MLRLLHSFSLTIIQLSYDPPGNDAISISKKKKRLSKTIDMLWVGSKEYGQHKCSEIPQRMPV